MLIVLLIPTLLFILCYILGDFLQMFFKFKSGIAIKIIIGYLLCTGIFHIISIPFMYKETAFTPLYILYLCILGVIVLAYLICSICLKRFKIKDEIFQVIKYFINDKKSIIIWGIVIFLIAFQLWKIYLYVHPNIDDQFYVSQVTTMLDRNRIMDIMPSSGEGLFTFPDMYKMVSFETWLGVICQLFSVAPAVLCHTVIPIFFIPLAYVVMYKVGKELLGDNAGIFMIFICLTNIFSGFSTYTQGAFLIMRIWQGKAVLVNIILPLLLFVFIKIMKDKKVSLNNILFLLALLIASFHTSTVGIVFIPISYAVYTIVYFAYTRKIKDFLKLCIPVLFILPLVIQKFIVLFSTTSIDAFSNQIEELIYKDVIYNFTKQSSIFILLFICFVFLIIRRKKLVSYLIVFYSVLLFALFLNPFVAVFVATKITGVAVYWRLFWLLQSGIIISVALTEATTLIKKTIPRIIVMACCAWLVVFSGNYIFNDKYFPKGIIPVLEDVELPEEYIFEDPRNLVYEQDFDSMYKISLFSIEISDIIKSIQKDEGLEDVNLLLTEKKSQEIRQYADINLVWFFYVEEYYKLAGLDEELNRLVKLYYDLYNTKKWDVDILLEELEYFNVDFIVMKVSAVKKNEIPPNFENLYQDETYILYRILK